MLEYGQMPLVVHAWVIKTAAYTAVAGDGVMVDTDSAAITITLTQQFRSTRSWRLCKNYGCNR